MYPIAKRIFDFTSSLLVLLILSPVWIILSLIILFSSKGGVFYRQIRIGKDGKQFKLLKFRSMYVGSDKAGEITVGRDKRITPIGHFVRRTKLDEIPQLFNILAGQMSVVGPRPEVPYYVEMYNEEQLRVLSVKPGLTDLASLQYINEQELLGKAEDPEKMYIEEVMPAKLNLNLEYISKRSFLFDLKLIFKTIVGIFR